jgi:predicted NACHT family NTPase
MAVCLWLEVWITFPNLKQGFCTKNVRIVRVVQVNVGRGLLRWHMAGQTNRASEAGISLIKAAIKWADWKQTELSKEAGFVRSTLNQILKGQSVRLEHIEELCHVLELEIGQVLVQEDAADIDLLVKQFRKASAESLRKRCGTMRILDMTQPIDSGAIYTDVNILERVAGKTRREITEMMTDCEVEEFDRFSLGSVQKRVEGLKAVLDKQQLIILGRPGAGKTTFLKRLAIQCLNEDFLGDRLPIFVTLKEFAETEGQPGILEFMASEQKALNQILGFGRALVLLDGLDEVMEKDHDRVIREIREFSEKYNNNHIVITCRIAAREYIFQQFTEVEIADFDDNQIQSFSDKWFKTKEGKAKSTTGNLFWQALEERKPVKELATSPLLLTLLCLEFDNSSAFPQSRSELYERALNVLLAKWDGQRRIKRDDVYEGLSLKRKETLLGQLAMYTFERGDYFFKERAAMGQVEQYIRNLSGASKNAEALLVDSRAVLKSIEAQHGLLAERATGIYSFSHLTFHEYFAAKNILDLSNPAEQVETLQRLIEHVGDKRWKEVFLLVVEGLDNANYVLKLMKQHIDSILTGDTKLQHFLAWVQEKSESIKVEVEVKFKSAALRAFYLDLDLNLALALDLDRNLDRNLDRALALALDLARDLALDLNLDIDLARNLALYLDIEIDYALNLDEDPELKRQLQKIYTRLPNHNDEKQFEQWWKTSAKQWAEDLRQIMIKYRNIGQDWQFTDEQKDRLHKYYDANLLLVNCLKSECYVSREVREEIEATMLLPAAEIEKWKSENRPT